MKKLLLLFAFLMVQPFFSQKTQEENTSLKEAVAFITNYYQDFTTEYDYKGHYKMLSNSYKATFSDSKFSLSYKKYDDDNKATIITDTFDLKKVTEMHANGGELVEIKESEPVLIPVALRIGFKIKDKWESVNIYVEDEDDIAGTPIYKAFENVWKYYKK